MPRGGSRRTSQDRKRRATRRCRMARPARRSSTRAACDAHVAQVELDRRLRAERRLLVIGVEQRRPASRVARSRAECPGSPPPLPTSSTRSAVASRADAAAIASASSRWCVTMRARLADRGQVVGRGSTWRAARRSATSCVALRVVERRSPCACGGQVAIAGGGPVRRFGVLLTGARPGPDALERAHCGASSRSRPAPTLADGRASRARSDAPAAARWRPASCRRCATACPSVCGRCRRRAFAAPRGQTAHLRRSRGLPEWRSVSCAEQARDLLVLTVDVARVLDRDLDLLAPPPGRPPGSRRPASVMQRGVGHARAAQQVSKRILSFECACPSTALASCCGHASTAWRTVVCRRSRSARDGVALAGRTRPIARRRRVPDAGQVSVSRRSALSSRSCSRYSARDVNMR